jgi:hypothetical protein
MHQGHAAATCSSDMQQGHAYTLLKTIAFPPADKTSKNITPYTKTFNCLEPQQSQLEKLRSQYYSIVIAGDFTLNRAKHSKKRNTAQATLS